MGLHGFADLGNGRLGQQAIAGLDKLAAEPLGPSFRNLGRRVVAGLQYAPNARQPGDAKAVANAAWGPRRRVAYAKMRTRRRRVNAPTR